MPFAAVFKRHNYSRKQSTCLTRILSTETNPQGILRMSDSFANKSKATLFSSKFTCILTVFYG